jgi:hypothetical protein
MHSEHRARYHVRPAAEVYPGDRISVDPQAIDAVNGDRKADAAVDWPAIERDAQLVQNRQRPTPTRLTFSTPSGTVRVGVGDDVLVVRERSDGTSEG